MQFSGLLTFDPLLLLLIFRGIGLHQGRDLEDVVYAGYDGEECDGYVNRRQIESAKLWVNCRYEDRDHAEDPHFGQSRHFEHQACYPSIE